MAWVLWKLVDSYDIIHPTPAFRVPRPGAAGDEQRAWDVVNRKLFGALSTAMPPWLATTLHLDSPADGLAAWLAIEARFGAKDVNDLAAATSGLHKSVIDQRADLNEDDLRHQMDSILVAK